MLKELFKAFRPAPKGYVFTPVLDHKDIRNFDGGRLLWTCATGETLEMYLTTQNVWLWPTTKEAEAGLLLSNGQFNYEAKLTGNATKVTCALHKMVVPDSLRRKGLGTAAIVALADVFLLMAFGQRVRGDTVVEIEGYWTPEGAAFAEAITAGKHPAPGSPKPVCSDIVAKARASVQLLEWPQPVV